MINQESAVIKGVIFGWRISKVIYFVLISCLIIVSISIKLSLFTSYFGYQGRVILSNSMSPRISSGSLVLTKEVTIDEVSVGDVIVVAIGEVSVGHRVIEKFDDSKTVRLKTQGDANKSPDDFWVTDATLKEQAVLSIPYLGMFLLKLQTVRGGIAAICFLLFMYVLDYFIKLLVDKGDGQCDK
ncbi:signal peptidase I [Vagococcus sp. PNs007]|uniref:Signal peptidase I n=1 Tax=Vagococcus proximus TaxID=2991417 RepID=A0ABT5X2R6_9ENTE|nr:signal peptidase I [Vagococcus proximus]